MMRFGDIEAAVVDVSWEAAPPGPMKQLYLLDVGQHVDDAPTTTEQHELFVMYDGQAVPAGGAVCRTFVSSMEWIFFTETWGKTLRIFDASLIRQEMKDPWHAVFSQLIKANNGNLGGLPDVVGQQRDGRILLCEVKSRISKDRIQDNQHNFARAAVDALGDKVELKVVVWG
jgi:hypothetical protein